MKFKSTIIFVCAFLGLQYLTYAKPLKHGARTFALTCKNPDASSTKDSVIYQSDNLMVVKISETVYVHVSDLNTDSFGKVPCNGMIVVSNKEAIIFDTPANAISSTELIAFLTAKQGIKIKAVVATHFHDDCVAGLGEFHQNKIRSYANSRTLRELRDRQPSGTMPGTAFDGSLKLKVGEKEVYAKFLGEGHTRDNIIGYFPAEHVLFGGCLIKELGAGKGNLSDANLMAWPETVRKIQKEFPKLKTVIPGHKKIGGPELLSYTLKVFK